MKKLLFFASTLLLLLNACRKEEVLEVLDVPANWDRTYTAPTNCANVVNNEKYFVIFRTGKLAYPQMHAIWMQANLQPAKNSNGQMLFGAPTTINQYCTDSNKVAINNTIIDYFASYSADYLVAVIGTDSTSTPTWRFTTF